MNFFRYIKEDPVKGFSLVALGTFLGVIITDGIINDEFQILPLLWFGGVFALALVGMYINYLKEQGV